MTVDKKTLSQLQIAMKLDEYNYEKNNQQYFESMPTIGLSDSQIIFINNYLEILEKKNDEKAKEFAEMFDSIKKENDRYQELIKGGSKSSLIKKYARMTAYLIRQMSKYDSLY